MEENIAINNKSAMHRFSNLVTTLLIFYFLVSGVLAIVDLDAKLLRIGLSALSNDGRIAFALIYTSMFVSIGITMAALWYLSGSETYSLLLAGIVVTCFVSFRIIGAIIVGELSTLQIQFIVTELLEIGIIAWLLVSHKNSFKHPLR